MDKYIFDKSNGLWYELQGDYYIPCLILAEEETQPIGLWGQRHKQYLKEHRHIVYTTMLIDGTLNRYLADINQQAEQMFHRLIEEMVQKQGVTEQLKAEQPMEWIGLMNNIQAYAREIVNNEIIFFIGLNDTRAKMLLHIFALGFFIVNFYFALRNTNKNR